MARGFSKLESGTTVNARVTWHPSPDSEPPFWIQDVDILFGFICDRSEWREWFFITVFAQECMLGHTDMFCAEKIQ